MDKLLVKEAFLLKMTLHRFNTSFYLHINTTDDDKLFLKNYNKNNNSKSGVLTKLLQSSFNFHLALLFFEKETIPLKLFK